MRRSTVVFLLSACGTPGPDSAGTSLSTGTTTATSVGNDVSLLDYPPVVISTLPTSGALGVDVGTDALSVTYSREMGAGYSWVQVNADLFPSTGGAAWLDTTTNQVSDVVLEDDHLYLLWLNSPYGSYSSFTDVAGTPALPYPLVFQTSVTTAPLLGLPCAVVSSDPVAGTSGVDPSTTRIALTFSQELADGPEGWEKDRPITWPAVLATGVDGATAWADVELSPSTTYAIRVNPGDQGFQDTLGNACAEWLLTFRTAGPGAEQ